MILIESNYQYVLQVCLSGISILFCMVILISYIAFKELRKSAQKLVLYLCLSEITYSLSMLIRPPSLSNNELCATQIFLSNLGHTSTLIWTCMITHTLRRSIQHGSSYVSRILKKVIIFSLVFPTILSFGILTRQYFFTDGKFCSILTEGIELEYTGFTWQRLFMLFEFWIPIIVATVFNLVIVLKVVKDAKEHTNNQALPPKLKRIFFYPFIIPFCQFFSLIYSIYILCGADPDSLNGVLSIYIVFSCMQGAINSVVYGFSQKLRTTLNQYFSRKNKDSMIASLISKDSSFVSSDSSSSFKSGSIESEEILSETTSKRNSGRQKMSQSNISNNSNNNNNRNPRQLNINKSSKSKINEGYDEQGSFDGDDEELNSNSPTKHFQFTAGDL